MKLTLLGVWGPFPAPGGGCSSYLIEDGQTRILLECGSGALGRLRKMYPGALSLDAIVLSHMHADHTGEIDLFRYMLEFGFGVTPLPVYAPETDRLRYPVFAPTETHDGMTVRIGLLSLHFFEVRHAVKTMAVRITDTAGHSLFYTADTRLFDGLKDAAKGADLLLADACLVDESNPNALRNHMTVRQVEALKNAAGCRRAILTHLFGGNDALPPLFDTACAYAVEGAIYEI